MLTGLTRVTDFLLEGKEYESISCSTLTMCNKFDACYNLLIA